MKLLNFVSNRVVNIGKILPPLCYFLQGDLRYYYYTNLLRNLKLSRPEIVNLQNQKLRKLIQHAYDSVPFYKDYFKKNKLRAEDIKNASDLSYLPMMTKGIIKNNIDELKSISMQHRKLIKVISGGPTGETAVIYKSPYFVQISRAATMRNFHIAGWLPQDKSAWIWASPYEHRQISKSIKARFGIFINNRLILNAETYSLSDFPFWVKKIRLFRPKVLYGYADIIREFAIWCIKNNVSLGSIERVITTAETLTDRKVIEEAFKCKVYDQYGSREVLSIAVECRERNMHISDDTVILEQDSENRLFITALDSFHFPIIRYEIGDIGTKVDKTCSCGLNFSCMDLKIGRSSDYLILPNGKKISDLITIISQNVALNKYQLIQNKIDDFELKFIGDLNGDEKEKFENLLIKYFGKIRIIFTPVDNVPLEKSGKRLLLKCLIKNYENTPH